MEKSSFSGLLYCRQHAQEPPLDRFPVKVRHRPGSLSDVFSLDESTLDPLLSISNPPWLVAFGDNDSIRSYIVRKLSLSRPL